MYGTVNLKDKVIINFSVCQIYGRPR